MAVVLMLGPPAAGKKFDVNPNGNTLIGRDPKCDITLNSKSISRFHAQIVSRKRSVYLEDCESTNGTFLNSTRLTKKTQLRDGDRFSLHDISMIYSLSDDVRVDEVPTDIIATDAQALTQFDLNVQTEVSSELQVKLESFVEIAKDLGSSFETNIILPRILDLLFQMYPQAVIGEIHLESERGTLVPVAMKHGRESDSTDLHGAPFNDDLLQEVFETGVGLTRTETTGPAHSAISELQSTICSPIRGLGKKTIGCILLETDDASHPFTETDRDLLAAVAVLAGQAISYASAHQIVLRHSKVQKQLETAREIQLSILPKTRPLHDNFAFAEFYSAAEQVGGDYYFYEQMADGRILVGIADASGKGLPAAMNIMNFAGEVRYRVATSPSLKCAMRYINQFVSQGELFSFITACICLLIPDKQQVIVMNAGHMPPLLKRSGHPIKEFHTPSSGLPLGVDPDEEYHASTYQLHPGDEVLLYTDGISEAMNSVKELYGSERIRTAMSKSQLGIQETVNLLVQDVKNFRDGTPPSDDTTVVAFQHIQ